MKWVQIGHTIINLERVYMIALENDKIKYYMNPSEGLSSNYKNKEDAEEAYKDLISQVFNDN